MYLFIHEEDSEFQNKYDQYEIHQFSVQKVFDSLSEKKGTTIQSTGVRW